MRLLTLFSLLCLLPALYGCPKKKAAGDEPTEKVEGSSTADKSGEGSSDEMQEKKGGSSDPAPDAPADAPADDKK